MSFWGNMDSCNCSAFSIDLFVRCFYCGKKLFVIVYHLRFLLMSDVNFSWARGANARGSTIGKGEKRSFVAYRPSPFSIDLFVRCFYCGKKLFVIVYHPRFILMSDVNFSWARGANARGSTIGKGEKRSFVAYLPSP